MLTAVEKHEPKLLAEFDSVAREFEALYARQFNVVWRNLRRWGVPNALIEDAAQDVFVVVHRRLAELRPGASRTAWLFGIALRVARDYRRRRQRKPAVNTDVDTHTSTERGPLERALHAEAARVLERFLSSLDQDKRRVFVLAELEEMSAPEIGQALNAPVNTVYSRLRIARERFVAFLQAEGVPHG